VDALGLRVAAIQGILGPRIMKRQISSTRLQEAYRKAKLGSEDSYYVWTPLWALRSKIWQDKSLRKVARNSLGDVVIEAINAADSTVLRQLANSLDEMLQAERTPEFSLRADVFFAVEELNSNERRFTRRGLLKWLNKEMDAVVTAEEVAEILEEMDLADLVK